MSNTCSDCAYCISYNGRSRCGRAVYGYMLVNITDESCDLFEPYEEIEEDKKDS